MQRIPAGRTFGSHQRRGDALKTVLIVLGILGGLAVLSCLGVGVAGYVWFQRNLANVAVTDPVKIRQMTSELTDITIPPEFVPQNASQLFGMHTVSYQWCPTGNCPAASPDEDADYAHGTLTLMTFQMNDPGDPDDETNWEESYKDEYLKEQYHSYTKEVKEFTIRGKASKFFIIKGEEIPWDETSDEEMEGEKPSETVATPATDAVATDPAATEPAPATSEPVAAAPVAAAPATTKPGKQVVSIHGSFPGKKGECSLNLSLLATDYDEAKILAMLQSIK